MAAPLLSADLFLAEFIEIKICFFGNVLHLTKPAGGGGKSCELGEGRGHPLLLLPEQEGAQGGEKRVCVVWSGGVVALGAGAH